MFPTVRIQARSFTGLSVRLAALCLGVSLLAGCAARHFTSLPDSSEFHKPVETLWQEYPEMAQCQPTFSRQWLWCSIEDMPYAQDLVDKWGEPDERSVSWWNLMPFAWVPPFHPFTVWEWEKSDKRITATVDHPLGYGYEPHVWTLDIESTGKQEP